MTPGDFADRKQDFTANPVIHQCQEKKNNRVDCVVTPFSSSALEVLVWLSEW